MSDPAWSRLREASLEAADPVVARAAWMLRGEDPLAPSAERIAKVRLVVLAQPPPPPRWGGAWRLVPSPAGAALAAGVLAAAGLFAWWLGREAAVPAESAVISTPPSTVGAGMRPAAIAGTAAPAGPAAPSPPAPPASPSPSPQPLPARVASRPRAPGPPAATSPEVAPTPVPPVVAAPAPTAVPAPAAPAVPTSESAARDATDPDGAELLVEATRLLRHEDDPAAARALIQRYLAGRPDGPLAEEALYLDIEAAGALQDGTLRPLAARYLARYPRGRFRAAVIGLRDGR